MANEEPNKEFTINVQFSGVEQDILGVFKKQIDDVAKSITLVNDTMSEATKVLERVTKELREIKDGGISVSGGGRGRGNGGGVTVAGQSSGDGSDLVRVVSDLSRTMERLGSGPGSLFGARGMTSGYRSLDQENSFEIPQYGPQSGFTIQDTVRQAASFQKGYRDNVTGIGITNRTLEQWHKDQEADPNAKHLRDYVRESFDSGNKWNPFRKGFAELAGRDRYINDEFHGERGSTAQVLDKFETVIPAFARGGVFNPGTYGLGMSNLRAKAAMIGSGYGRWDAQFGGDTTFSPFGDSGHQYFGAKAQALRNSWMGFNPFLSSKQAAEIQTSVAGMGYSGGTAENMRGMMSDVTQHTNIGIGDQAAIIDKSFRWGYANLQQLAAFMKNDIPAAAMAARVNVGQFAAQLHTVGTSLGQGSGMNPFVKMSNVANLAVGTGVDPGTAQQVLGDNGLSYLAGSIMAQQTGHFSMGALDFSPQNASYYAKAVQSRVFTNLGASPDQIQKWTNIVNGNGSASEKAAARQNLIHVQDGLDAMARSGQGIAGAGTIEEIQRWTDKHVKATTAANTASQFGRDFMAQYAKGKDAFESHHGGDGGHSFWSAGLGLEGFDWLTGDKTPAQRAADKKAQQWASHQGNRKDVLRKIHNYVNGAGMDDSALGNIFGHTTEHVGGSTSKQTREVLGDPTRGMDKIWAAFYKEIAKKEKQTSNKNSKGGGKLQVTLVAGPGLQGLIGGSFSQGPKAAGGAAPSIDPSQALDTQYVDTGG